MNRKRRQPFPNRERLAQNVIDKDEALKYVWRRSLSLSFGVFGQHVDGESLNHVLQMVQKFNFLSGQCPNVLSFATDFTLVQI
jgi:hypothetical protein